MAERRTGWVYHESYMWHDTGRTRAFDSGAAPLDAGLGALGESRHQASAEQSAGGLGLLRATRAAQARARPMRSRCCGSTRPSTSTTCERSRRRTAATRAKVRRSRTAATRSRCSRRAARSRRWMPCWTATWTTPTRSCDRPDTTPSGDRGRGFCIFGNVAIAAMHALAERGIDKVADAGLGRPPRQRHAAGVSTTARTC